ncbi:MAG: RusA family crossover junction endodeoxyribonuclease [Gallionellaceae bacterium]
MRYEITPVPKPRQTRADKWKKRPCVMRYREFADKVRAAGISIDDSSFITFVMPMPKSWGKKKRAEMDGQPHRQKPDIDNLAKAIFDAVHEDDAFISVLFARKLWGKSGSVNVDTHPHKGIELL